MKKVVQLIILVGFSICLHGQVTYTYTYDAVGNRTGRTASGITLKNIDSNGESIFENNGVNPDIIGYPDWFNTTEVMLYPNPTRSELVIQLNNSPDNISAISYKLYNLEGRLLWQKSSMEKFIILDLTYEKSGEYILKLTVENHEKTYKVIKQD